MTTIDRGIKENVMKNIRLFRQMSGMYQYQLAEKIGVSPQSMCMYETGTCMPSVVQLFRISEVFGVPMGVFVKDWDKVEGLIYGLLNEEGAK